MLDKKVIRINILILFIGQLFFVIGLLDYFVPFDPLFRFFSCASLVGAIITLVAAYKLKNGNYAMKNVFLASLVLIILALARFIIGCTLEGIGNYAFILINYVLAIIGLLACGFLTYEMVKGVKNYGINVNNEKLGRYIWIIFFIYVVLAIITSLIGLVIWCMKTDYTVTKICNCVIFSLALLSEGMLCYYLYNTSSYNQ